jgi:predicted nucleic acid-binding protein
MVAIDNTTLALLLHPKAKPPIDPKTKLPLEKCKERIEQLILDIEAEDERVVVPTPVLSEFLILAGKEGQLYLEMVHKFRTLLIKPFDELAAIELAGMELADRAKVGKKGGSDAPYQKVKFDRQIVAVAKVNGAHTLYSDDDDVRKFAIKAGIKVVSTWELAIPPSKTPLFDELDDLPEPTTAPHDGKKKS